MLISWVKNGISYWLCLDSYNYGLFKLFCMWPAWYILTYMTSSKLKKFTFYCLCCIFFYQFVIFLWFSCFQQSLTFCSAKFIFIIVTSEFYILLRIFYLKIINKFIPYSRISVVSFFIFQSLTHTECFDVMRWRSSFTLTFIFHKVSRLSQYYWLNVGYVIKNPVILL